MLIKNADVQSPVPDLKSPTLGTEAVESGVGTWEQGSGDGLQED